MVLDVVERAIVGQRIEDFSSQVFWRFALENSVPRCPLNFNTEDEGQIVNRVDNSMRFAAADKRGVIFRRIDANRGFLNDTNQDGVAVM